jgi:hypothetical protein
MLIKIDLADINTEASFSGKIVDLRRRRRFIKKRDQG